MNKLFLQIFKFLFQYTEDYRFLYQIVEEDDPPETANPGDSSYDDDDDEDDDIL